MSFDFKSSSVIKGYRPILLDLNVDVGNMLNECDFIRSGSVENQSSKYTQMIGEFLDKT